MLWRAMLTHFPSLSVQGVTTLGTIYSSSLFPGRCPGGEMLLLNYIGGATNRGVKEVRVGDNFRHTLAMPLPRVLSFCCVNVTSAPVCILSPTAEAEAPRQHLLQSCTCNSAVPMDTCCTLHLTHPPPPPPPQASQEELAAQVDKDLRTMLLVP